MSPILFNLVADVFLKMLYKASVRKIISGVLPNVVPDGIISLQYADDTLLFLDPNIDNARNVKWLVSCFECLSGMKIKFNKSDLLTINVDEEVSNILSQIFCCKRGTFPLKYLGVPLHFAKLRREDLQPIVDKIIKRICGWRGRLLSYEAKLVLLRTCIASIPTYLMSVIKFPKWAIKAITSQMAHFLWGNVRDVHKYHLANWGLVSQKKQFGGLGVPNLREVNMSLLASWAKRYFADTNKNWVSLVEYKYQTNKPNLLWSKEKVGSPFWKSFSWALAGVRPFYKWVVGDGSRVSFWHDVWVGDISLKTQFWDVFDLCQQQNCTVQQVWDGRILKLTFRRCVNVAFLDQWNALISVVQNAQPSDKPDEPVWTLDSSGKYTTKSFYKLINWGGIATPIWDKFWKIKVPHRYLVFVWLAIHNKILTRDNLSKRQTVEDVSCLFCSDKETVDHLLCGCIVAKNIWVAVAEVFNFPIPEHIADVPPLWDCNNKISTVGIAVVATIWSLWTTRNDLCFQGATWRDTRIILGKISRLLHFWLILYSEEQVMAMKLRLEVLDKRRGELLRIAWREEPSSAQGGTS